MTDILTALLWWPVITYCLGVLLFQAAAIQVWRTDDQVNLTKAFVMAFIWPRYAVQLFQ